MITRHKRIDESGVVYHAIKRGTSSKQINEVPNGSESLLAILKSMNKCAELK
jgi:hypothetical protein